MPEIHSRQPGFMYSACGPFTKNKTRIQKFEETGNSRYIYQNKPDKACFQHDVAYVDFKDLPKRTVSDKVLCDKAFNIAKSPKHDGSQGGLASMAYKVFDKKASGGAVKGEIMSNLELAEELHKPIIRKIGKWKVHSFFTDNIWGADLANMQLRSKFNKGICFFLCVIDVYSKYV